MKIFMSNLLIYSINLLIGEDVLEWENRFTRLVQEIKQYNCDILCLQEVQNDHFDTHFKPSLKTLGYDGVYKKRTGDKHDGCAIFFKVHI